MTNETLPFAYTVLVSNALDAEIRSFNLDTATGRIDPSLTYAAADAVMPMALSADRKLLYVATRGVAPSIITYCVDSLTGQLSRLGTAANIESSLAYLCAEPSGRYLLGASYGEHRLSIYSVDGIAQANGKPLQVIENIEHAHAVIVSPDARFAYVSSLGSNRVFCFSLDAGLTGEPAAFVEHASLGEGFGPRHLRFSPDSTMLYVLSEFRATVALFQRDSVTGHIDPKGVSARPQAISELNDGRARPNLTAAVQLDPKTLQSLVWAADLQVTQSLCLCLGTYLKPPDCLSRTRRCFAGVRQLHPDRDTATRFPDRPHRPVSGCVRGKVFTCRGLRHQRRIRSAFPALALRRWARSQLGRNH
jgi:6-phosphogluconolactonase